MRGDWDGRAPETSATAQGLHAPRYLEGYRVVVAQASAPRRSEGLLDCHGADLGAPRRPEGCGR
jgi:hypothetical protein